MGIPHRRESLPAPESRFEPLRLFLETELRNRPDGFSEYQLLRHAQAAGFLAPTRTGDSLSLFRIHFSLFHALYTLRDQLRAASGEEVEISALRIRLRPPAPERGRCDQLQVSDPLREYYLDLGHLHETTRDEVDGMLNRFWRRMAQDDRRERALARLGLSDPVDDATIKRRYRSLVMRHHPDRGGDTADFQAINEALRALI